MIMNVLVLGANSYIGEAIGRAFARHEHADLTLASRGVERLGKRARDIALRYRVAARAVPFDALAFDTHRGFNEAFEPRPDGVVLAFGYLGDQSRAEGDFAEAQTIVDVNMLGAMSILDVVADDFERRGSGFIIGLSSVAGERGRRRNYVYGAAKAGLTTYLSGLRARLARRKVRVMTVLPGRVRTKMTEHLGCGGTLWADPEAVAADVYRAWRRGRDVVYTPGYWRWIMRAIRSLPEPLVERLGS